MKDFLRKIINQEAGGIGYGVEIIDAEVASQLKLMDTCYFALTLKKYEKKSRRVGFFSRRTSEIGESFSSIVSIR